MLNPIKEIYKWQVDAGNAERPYDDFLESSFQIEEALEGFDNKLLSSWLYGPEYFLEDCSPKALSREIVIGAKGSNSTPITDVDRLDKACDAIVYAIGSMAKLGLNPQQITQALTIVNNANKQKLNCPRDEAGKLLKGTGFVGPEKELQKLLDKVNSQG